MAVLCDVCTCAEHGEEEAGEEEQEVEEAAVAAAAAVAAERAQPVSASSAQQPARTHQPWASAAACSMPAA